MTLIEERIMEEYRMLMNTYILPLFQLKNNQFEFKNDSREIIESTDDIFILETKCLTYFNKCILVNTKLNIQRNLANVVWNSLMTVFPYVVNNGKIINSFGALNNFQNALYESAYVWGISQWLGGGTIDNTIYTIVRGYMKWSMKTYEGHRVQFGTVIDCNDIFTSQESDEHQRTQFVDLLMTDASASLSDGVNTFFAIDKKGYIKSVLDVDSSVAYKNSSRELESLSPNVFIKVCKASQRENVGICLSESGDIYCFKKRQLKIARINGRWVIFDYESFKKQVEPILDNENKIKQLYLTCLDVSYARTGGCLAVCNDYKALINILPKQKELDINASLLRIVEQRDFFQLPKNIRKELVAIDGATIINREGTLKNIGTIIKKVSSSIGGGGRRAAAKQLSKYGMAIKISADGYIELFINEKIVLEFK